jgi:hypothetical protein
MNGHAAIRQHDTHRELVPKQVEAGSTWPLNLDLDAIIVPGTRPAAYLDHAVTLARAADCWLVVVCSRHLRGADVKEYLAARSFLKAIVVDLPPGYSHNLLSFPGLSTMANQLPRAWGFHATDLSMKRNIGLILAKMMAWRRIFFLDDDIRDITYPDLQRTVDMLGSFSAAGMWVTEFPDNSIVCHANRMTGGYQDVFVSGAALAVNCDSDIGFFPEIYNEDWLFFFDTAANGLLGNSYLKATQLYYYPFTNARRAAWQEFGDILAEGLYSLLHLRMDVQQATSKYWEYFLEARRNFLEAILTRAELAPPDMRNEISASVQSALKCLAEIKPDVCERYVQMWRQDLARWKQRLAEVPVLPSVEAVQARLAQMGLGTPTDSKRRILHPQDVAMAVPTAGAVTLPRFDTLPEIAGHVNAWRLDPRSADGEETPTIPLPAVRYEARGRRIWRGIASSWPDITRVMPRPPHRASVVPSTSSEVAVLPCGEPTRT